MRLKERWRVDFEGFFVLFEGSVDFVLKFVVFFLSILSRDVV